jgi:MFS transporter, DHA2 family, multidrug resistance protein
MGTLGDRIGRRRLLLIGAGAFGVASVLAAFSTSPEMLIVARAILGVAAATIAPSTLSLISNMFRDPGQRTVAIGLWVTSYSAGAAIGPLVGGVLLEHFWWGSVFLAGVPVMALLLAVGPRLLPESRDPNPGRFDLPSAGLSLLAVLTVIYGVKNAAEHGFGFGPAVSIWVGVLAGAVFLRRQRRLDDPMIDLRMFRIPSFSASLGAQAFAFFAFFGIELFIAQYLQLVLGMKPLEAGLWTLPAAAGFIVGSNLAPAIASRVSAGLVVAGGAAATAVGLAIMTQIGPESGVTLLSIGSIVMSLGAAQVVTLSTDLVVSSAPPERAGTASAISETGAEFGAALGIALLGSLGTAIYGSKLAGVEHTTLGAAVESGNPTVIDAAVHAFTSGMNVVAAIGAILMGAVAVAAWRLLREPTPAPVAAVAPAPC